ncbi:MAG: hypothetical protein ACI8UO_006654 [Verrucomicrobiales bacterium]
MPRKSLKSQLLFRFGKFDDLEIGTTKDYVFSRAGDPSRQQANHMGLLPIAVYGDDLQFNFDLNNTIEEIILKFTAGMKCNFGPYRLDIDVVRDYTVDQLKQYIRSLDLKVCEERSSQTSIEFRVNDIKIRFQKSLNYNESVKKERLVVSDEFYLTEIRLTRD